VRLQVLKNKKSKEVMMNFKIRVVENIGGDSQAAFGPPGTVLEIKDGTFTDLEGYEWDNKSLLYEDISDIISHFSNQYPGWYSTAFELVEEEQDDKE
jgi:hypothetical protein